MFGLTSKINTSLTTRAFKRVHKGEKSFVMKVYFSDRLSRGRN